jgi:hypothetical protein
MIIGIERKMNRSEVSSKWNKYRIHIGDQLDHWNELKEVLRVQTRAEVAKILLHHKFIKYEKRLRKEGKNMLGLPIKQNLCHFSASLDA